MSNYWYGGNNEVWDSDYDSTWEDDEDHKLLKKSQPKNEYREHSRNKAAQDLQRYRHGYSDPMPNLRFYRNKMPFQPYGIRIDDLHKHWKNDYYELESNHSFIQWLFPLREPGMNSCATPLTKKEIEEMKKDEEVMERFLESYKLMLGFYGIELEDSETGKLARARNWKDRFSNLNAHTHNNLRITRILKCLGEMGYEHFQFPLVKFFLEETLCHGHLKNVQSSALEYFMFTVKNKNERKKLVLFAWENYPQKEHFKWGPVETLKKLRPPAPSPVADRNNDMEDMQDRKRENTRARKNGHKKNGASPINCVSEEDKKNEGLPTEIWMGNGNRNEGQSVEFGLENKENEGLTVDAIFPEDTEKKRSLEDTGLGAGKESGGSPVDFESEGDQTKRVALSESGSGHNKDIEGALTESRSQDHMKLSTEPELRDDKKDEEEPILSNSGYDQGRSPMEFGLRDDKDNRGSSTEFEVGVEEHNEGSLTEDRSSSNKKDGQSIESGSGGNINEVQLMEFDFTDDKDNRGSMTEFGLGDEKQKGRSLTEDGSSSDKKDGRSPNESMSIGNENEGSPMKSVLESNKEKEESIIGSGPKEDKEYAESQVKSGSVDDNEKPLTQSESGKDENGRSLIQTLINEENISSPVEFKSGDDKERQEGEP
ncbi:uncharacterized protein ACMZJ9_017556 isoform 2-T3 [Mantella aurantiaca]